MGLAILGAGLVFHQASTLDATYVVFISLAGLAMGSIALLMIGHLMQEQWLAPVRAEAEAAGLTAPLLLFIGIPLAFGLDQLFPWARGADLPPERASFLSPSFFIVRTIIYLGVCSGIAFWLIRTRNLRHTSAIGLVLLAPIMTFAAYDWVLSREPQWWFSLFGFAFAVSQLLAALAGAMLITLLKGERGSPQGMASLERALLTLALLALWTWFAQFLIVWMANLPSEAAWYLARASKAGLGLAGGALATMILAIVILVPSGFSRFGMIIGSALVLLQHGLHMIWILQPPAVSFGLVPAAGTAMLWTGAFMVLLRSRWRREDALIAPL
ncbi:hypothetical protein [Microvirga brassicacearum]|uniref:Uncharacterized protein n=1 Tax=Microvirga brassicacearum TaxID=2580413 RepID=A0A5N3PCH6_9HYPH|nr:hypothetical protein [Microvirga brassicacearum]KAB0267429.1 hypothetical protein FEZ63_08955 [Microvirga brassicacearum]